MTDRYRLIELISNSHCVETWDYYNDEPMKPCPIERLANYLLENGVIVPPCKVGDVVYKLFPPYCHKREEDKCDHYCDGYDTTCEEYEGVYEIYDVPFKLGMFNDFGKTVFLTKEEAEAKLKERKEDEGK